MRAGVSRRGRPPTRLPVRRAAGAGRTCPARARPRPGGRGPSPRRQPLPGHLQRPVGLGAGHCHHAVVVGAHDVARADNLAAEHDGHVHRARRRLDRALACDVPAPRREAHGPQVGGVAHFRRRSPGPARPEPGPRWPAGPRRSRAPTAPTPPPPGRRRAGRSRPRRGSSGCRPDGRARSPPSPRSGFPTGRGGCRARGSPAADGLVHSGCPHRRQSVDDRRIGPLDAAHHHRSPVITHDCCSILDCRSSPRPPGHRCTSSLLPARRRQAAYGPLSGPLSSEWTAGRHGDRVQ